MIDHCREPEDGDKNSDVQSRNIIENKGKPDRMSAKKHVLCTNFQTFCVSVTVTLPEFREMNAKGTHFMPILHDVVGSDHAAGGVKMANSRSKISAVPS